MADEKTSATTAIAVQDEPVLTIGVLMVKVWNGIGITKSRASLLKADPMFAQILFCLTGIPFKAHDRSPST